MVLLVDKPLSKARMLASSLADRDMFMRFRGGGIGHIYMRQIEQWLDTTGWGTTWPLLRGEDPNPDLPSDNGDSPGHGIDGVEEDVEEDGDRGEDEDDEGDVGKGNVDDEDGEDQEQPVDSDEDSDEEENRRDGRHHPSQSTEGEWDESDEELSL